jgi:hypothetical protein
MSFPTTISITARVDMQDQLEGFVSNKSLPGARVTLGDRSQEHRFTRPGEEHRFTVTAVLERGPHDLSLEFTDASPVQGAIEVLGLHLNGCPMGLEIYQCEYQPFHNSETLRSHLYMGWPGRWSMTIEVPGHENHGGVGFG